MTDFDRIMLSEIAEGERWLASLATPGPSPAALERTRHAVRAALSGRTAGAPARPWSVWHGILAAAASLALAVTVGWRSAGQYTATEASAEELLASGWFERTGGEAQTLSNLDEELTSLETWSAEEPWNVNGVDLYETLDGVLNEGTDSDATEPGSTMVVPGQFRQREDA